MLQVSRDGQKNRYGDEPMCKDHPENAPLPWEEEQEEDDSF